ncbi:MAG: peptidoglycan-binding protein [Rhodobacteraceae bacterium]|nr:peptidoglycan-binding protein [Paracoccaceae bacterium]
MPATKVVANDFLGGVVTGVILHGLANQPRKPRGGVSSSTRAINAETQTALNYFGFDAGTPDGVMGQKSRAATVGYQSYIAMPPTGNLTQLERDILVGAYNRALAGSAETLRLTSKDPDGVRALLVVQRDLMTGSGTPQRRAGYAGLPIEVSDAIDEIADSSDPSAEQLLQRSGFIQLADLNSDGNTDYILDTSASGSSFWCNAQQCKTIVFVSVADGYRRNNLLLHDPQPASFECFGGTCNVRADAVPPATGGATGGGAVMASSGQTGAASLPMFNTAAVQPSLSSHCSKVSLLTNSNGGFTSASNVDNPEFALNEQFCLARTFAIAEGETLIGNSRGVSQADIEAQCPAFGEALAGHVADLGVKPVQSVVAAVSGFVRDNGISADQMAASVKICLAVGYRTDDMKTALGTGLLLIAFGETPYAELIGHHLLQGFGTAKRGNLAAGWYDLALSSLDNGSIPVFAPSQPGRIEVLRQASMSLSGGAAGTATTGGVLPVFAIKE